MRRRKHMVVRNVLPTARGLHTVRPEAPLWADPLPTAPDIEQDCLVRVCPPNDATDGQIAALRRALLDAGAAGVRVYARSQEVTVRTGGAAAQMPAEVRIANPRETVEAMVATACERDPELGDLKAIVAGYLDTAEGKARPKTGALVDVGHIQGIRLENWLCYKGEHVLHLGPTVYSITATASDDPERSNWLGKSSLLKAIVFALTGEYPSRTADGWIHGAEASGGVDLEFANGMFISRWKERGKATQLEVTVSGGEEPDYTGKAAQQYLEESVITSADLHHCVYLAQKAIDKFVTMGATERSATVSRWLDIEWLGDAGAECRDDLNTASKEEQRVREQLEAIRAEHGDIETELAAVEAEIEALPAKIAELDRIEAKRYAAEDNVAAAIVEWDRNKRYADRHAALLEELEQQPLPEVAADPDIAPVTEAVAEERRCAAELRTAEQLQRGEFDGACPVSGGQCPIADEINAAASQQRQRVRQARVALAAAGAVAKRTQAEHRRATSAKLAYERAHAKREAARAEAARLLPAAQWLAANPQRPTPAASAAREAPDQRPAMRQRLAEAKVRHGALMRAQQTVAGLIGRLPELQRRAVLLREALAILGRNGAQRVIAEAALAAIEQAGNRALERAGIDLRFRVRWSQETQKPAEACDHCGAPFPSSTRVKSCQRCGKDRGRKLSFGLRIALQNVSGGAEDLGGLMFQLAAAQWLRGYGGSGFPVFLIDEPFGALDTAHTKRMAAMFGQLLQQVFGARQAFVVAHTADVVESMPGRIHITSDHGASRVEVVGG